MGVDQEKLSRIISGGTADVSQRDLELLGLRHRVAAEQEVHRGIRRQERKSIEDLEAAEGQTPSLADPLEAQGRLVDQLHGQSRLEPHSGLSRPTAQQVPRAQPEVFRNQQPQAHRGVTDLVGESLSDAAFEADRIAVGLTNHLTADLGRDLFGGPARPAAVEFFFAGHTRR